MTTWRRLQSKKDYKSALNRINELIDAPRTEVLQNELLLISYLIEEYENIVYPMADAAPQDVIKFAMEMKGIKQKELIPILGSKGNVSRILNGTRNIPREKIHELSSFLGIPITSLIPEPILKSSRAASAI